MNVILLVILVIVGDVFSELYKSNDSDKQLRLVHVIFRHGARTPVKPYLKDQYFNYTYYPFGLGHLTNVGKMEQYQLGQYLRERYNSFLGDLYFDDLVIARSTKVPRVFMSCALTLAGMWPVKGTDLDWNPNLNWSPIPIFVDPFLTDAVIEISDTCPKYSREYSRVLAGPNGRKIFQENIELINEIYEITGENMTELIQTLALDGTFKSQKKLGLKLNERITKIIPELTRLVESYLELRTQNNLLKRLKMGRFINQMINYWKAKSKNAIIPENVKMFVYGAHDTTIADFLSAIGAWKRHVPEFSETILLELFEDLKTKKFSVKINSKIPSEENARPLTIKGCKEYCPLEKIIALTKHVVLEDIEKGCKI